jgi:hypothetical protein
MNEATAEINDLVIRYGQKMSENEYAETLDLWDRAIKGTPVGTRVALLKSRLRDAYGRSPSPPQPQQAGSLQKAGDRPQKLTGPQMAARKAGIDINTPGLAEMTYDQMRALAGRQTAESVKDLARKNSAFYRGAPDPNGWWTR